jgi:hypothetical protein
MRRVSSFTGDGMKPTSLPSFTSRPIHQLLSYFSCNYNNNVNNINDDMMMMMIIQFFIYLRAELNSQWPITESARIQTATVVAKHTQKKI